MKSKVSIVKCPGYEPALVQETTKRAVDLIGGVSSFIKSGSKVLLKPNLLLAKEPEFGITTHPEVLRAVVRLLKGINCQIFVGDGPSVWGGQTENVDTVYERTGTKRVCDEEGIELVRFDNRRWRGKFPLTVMLDTCEYLVSIPKFKTHDLTILTGAIKNLFGLVWGTYKTELHKQYTSDEAFAKILVDIYQEARPALTVVDGIVAMEGDGPASGGKLRNLNLLLAADDCVALDSVLGLIMGINPYEIKSTREAAKRNLGVMDLDSIQILGEKLAEVIPGDFKLPTTSLARKIPAPIIEIAKKLIRFYPKVIYDNCILCGACVKACPSKVISIKKGRIYIDYSGCISCFCCQEACAYAAIEVKKSMTAKILGL